MPNFILAGDHSDGAMEANHARRSGQHQSAEAEELAEQSASGEQHLSLTLVQREYSYNRLKSWWQSVERQINQNASDDRRKHDWRNSIANGESTTKDCASEPQDDQLEGPTDVVRDLEERVQAPEPELEQSARSDRRSMQATPEALFLAEKLQQLADTTREMAQHLLSPEAVRSRRGSTPGREVPDLENSVESRDLELVRRKVQLLDDVVDELSQYRAPFALDMTERSTGESSESECRRNDSQMTSNGAVVGSTNGDGADFQQELYTSTSDTFIAGDTPNAVPNARKILNMWSNSLITEKDLLNAAVTTEQGSEDAETSATSADDDPQYQQFAAELTREPRTIPVQSPQRETEVGSPRSHLNVSISNFSPQQLRFSTGHLKASSSNFSPQQLRFSMGHLKASSSNFSPLQLRFSMGHLKLAAGTAHRIRESVSKRNRLDRVTTTALRLLSYPILRHVLHEAETDIIGEDTFVGQKTALQVVQRDVAPSGTELYQQESEMNSSSCRLDISASDLLQEQRTGICHGYGRPSEVGHTAYQGQQEASKPRGIDGMIALVERLLRLKIMGHA